MGEATTPRAVTLEIAKFRVSLLTEADCSDYYAWDVYVERSPRRGSRDWWAVRTMFWVLDADGEWDHEPIPSSRDDEWMAEHRFDLETAQRLAVEAAPLLKINGLTPADVIAGHWRNR